MELLLKDSLNWAIYEDELNEMNIMEREIE